MEEKDFVNTENTENTEKKHDLSENENTSTDKKTTSKKKKKTSELETLKEQIKELENKNEELKDKYLRIVAEYDNYRKRTAKEKLELRDSVKSSLILDFLPIVDDMERAVQHIETANDIKAMSEGIKLIYTKFTDFLKSQGLIEIDAKDKEFDTDLHEAVTRFPVSEEDKKGKVIDVLNKGYLLNDKVVRFAKVVVGE